MTERPTHGHYECLIRVLSRDDSELYRNFVTMNEALFNEIVERIQPHLEKQRNFWRKPLDVGLRLAVTLRFLALGCSYKDMAFEFRVVSNTISYIPPWYRTNPPSGSYIGADGRFSGGSLRILVNQIRSIRIDCVSFGSIIHNTDWMRISCGSTAFRLRMLSRGGRLRFFFTFKKNHSPSTVPCGLLRIVADHGGWIYVSLRIAIHNETYRWTPYVWPQPKDGVKHTRVSNTFHCG